MSWSWRASVATSMALILLSVEIVKPRGSDQEGSINLAKPRPEDAKESVLGKKAKLCKYTFVFSWAAFFFFCTVLCVHQRYCARFKIIDTPLREIGNITRMCSVTSSSNTFCKM